MNRYEQNSELHMNYDSNKDKSGADRRLTDGT